METKIIDFYTEDGVKLNGYIKSNKSSKIIISCHGMTSNCFKERDYQIADIALENGIDFFAFNSRGSEVVKFVHRYQDGTSTKFLGGTCFEDVREGYYDIKAAIEEVIARGYEKIYLQGHSLGSTKTLYTYTRLKKEDFIYLENIKGIILLSLVDIPTAIKAYLGENYEKTFKYAKEKSKNGNVDEIMPEGSFINPISVKTFLIYTEDNKDIDFAKYSDENYDFKELNGVDVPLFMRFGNENEMILQKADDLVKMLNNKIKKKDKDISYINGADHSYHGKERILSNEIVSFIKKYDEKK